MMKSNEFYCLMCKEIIKVNPKSMCCVKTKRGGNAVKSKCDCGCKLFKFIKKGSASRKPRCRKRRSGSKRR